MIGGIFFYKINIIIESMEVSIVDNDADKENEKIFLYVSGTE